MDLLHAILTGTTILSTITIGLIIFFLGEEGRYELKRSVFNDGVDLLFYDRLSNNLGRITAKFNGKFWDHKGKQAFFDLAPLRNPGSEFEGDYNKAVTNTPHWKGSRRPVLFAVKELFYAFTPDFVRFLENSTHMQMLDLATEGAMVKPSNPGAQFLLDLSKQGYESVSMIRQGNLKTILDHIDGMTSWQIMETYDMGEDAGIQLVTRPEKRTIKTWQIVIGAAAIFALIFLAVVLQKGGLPLPSVG